jgi:hypothetical protein
MRVESFGSIEHSPLSSDERAVPGRSLEKMKLAEQNSYLTEENGLYRGTTDH